MKLSVQIIQVICLMLMLLCSIKPVSGQSGCIKCDSNSIAAGKNSLASGKYAIAIGSNDTANEQSSCAIGYNLLSSGFGSIVLGNSSKASGSNSFTAGFKNENKGTSALSLGNNNSNSSTSSNSMIFGNFVSSTGRYSIGIGTLLHSNGDYSLSIGSNIKTTGNASITIGSGGIGGGPPLLNDKDTSFMLGFNSSFPTLFVGPSRTSTGYGNVGIGTTSPKAVLDVWGNIAVNGKAVIDSTGKWLGASTGLKGSPGINGATWITGTKNPNDTGNVNDLYLNTKTDSVFIKLTKGWKGISCLKGEKGSSGNGGGCNPDTCAQAAKAAGDSAIAAINSTVNQAIGPTGTGGSIGAAVTHAIGAGGVLGGVIGAVVINAIGLNGTSGKIGEAVTNGTTTLNRAEKTAIKKLDASTKTAEQKVDSIAKAAEVKIEEAANIAKTKIEEAKEKEDECAAAAKQSAGEAKKYAEEAKKTMSENAGGDLFGKYPNPRVVKLQGRNVSSVKPKNGQVLRWSSDSNFWAASTVETTNYHFGTGLYILRDTVNVHYNKALWNADKLQNRNISSKAPANGQVLKWDKDSSKWIPSSIVTSALGWTLDSVKADTLNMYASNKGFVGIGTKHPKALFHLQAGVSESVDSTFVFNRSGQVGIGTLTTSPNYKLSVNGGIRAKKIVVESNWADFVFAQNYQLMPLSEVAVYIKENKHLPGIPKANEVEQEGQDLGHMQVLMMQKIEELTLYMIDANERTRLLANENVELKQKLLLLENQFKTR